MIETITTLIATMMSIQSVMTNYDLPIGRAYAVSIRLSRFTDIQLEANKPSCCEYYKNQDGTILKATNIIFLMRVR